MSTTDPRVTRSREAIREAVIRIIQTEGPGAVTHQHVADRAGVGRATVYRHWPKPEDLLLEAMQQLDLPFLEPTPDAHLVPLRERLRADLRHLRDNLAAPIMPSMIATIIDRGQREDIYRGQHQRLIARAIAHMETALGWAVERGELDLRPDADALVSQLLGPLVFRRLIADRPTSDDLIDHIIESALAPVASRNASA